LVLNSRFKFQDSHQVHNSTCTLAGVRFSRGDNHHCLFSACQACIGNLKPEVCIYVLLCNIDYYVLKWQIFSGDGV